MHHTQNDYNEVRENQHIAPFNIIYIYDYIYIIIYVVNKKIYIYNVLLNIINITYL